MTIQLKKLIFVTLVFFQLGVIVAQKKPYEDPEIFRVGLEPNHATIVPHWNAFDALTAKYLESDQIKSLNGDWKFKFVEGKENIPLGFEKSTYDVSSWDDIKVPSNWERQGFGVPIYANTSMSIEPDDVGCYRFNVNIPRTDLINKRVFLYFTGVRTAMHTYVNGEEMGYSEGVALPIEFDITKQLQSGENTIAVKVYRKATSVILENEDYWRLSGIFRDVYLVFRSPTYVEDFEVNGDMNGNWKVKARIINKQDNPYRGLQLTARLYDTEENEIAKQSVNVSDLLKNASDEVEMTTKVEDIKLWSAEKPNLYRTVLELAQNGNTLEAMACNTGFRTVKLENELLLVNGQSVKIKGVNAYGWDGKNAQASSYETLEKEVVLMKQNNINAVRACFYPAHPYFLELCDTYGIYVMDEAGIETHYQGDYHNLPEWKGTHLDRVQRMLERDKNHPSVIIWSCGNETLVGDNTEATYHWLKQRDPSRLVYNDAEDKTHQLEVSSDILGHGYVNYEKLMRHFGTKGKSVIVKEYAHSMGNAIGQLDQLWDIMRDPKYKKLQGGFIWDFVDQGWEMEKDGKTFYDYGKLSGKTMQEHFCINGIVQPDRKPTPKLIQVKKVYADIKFEALNIENLKFKVTNYSYFTNLDAYNFKWELLVDGKKTSEGNFDVSLAPQSDKEITLNIAASALQAKGEKLINFRAFTKEAQLGIPANHEIAWEQIPLSVFKSEKATLINKIKVSEKGEMVVVKNKKSTFTFNKKTGALTSWIANGAEVLAEAPIINTWRSVTDNDISGWGGSYVEYFDKWNKAGLNATTNTLKEINVDKNTIVVKSELTAKSKALFELEITYEFTANSGLKISTKAIPTKRLLSFNMTDIPRFGWDVTLTNPYNNITWYGRGPHENYIDRNSSTLVAEYNATIDELHTPYIFPQANGNHTDTRWMETRTNKGNGLRYTLEKEKNELYNFTASPYSETDLDNAEHTIDLKKDGNVHLHIDYKHSGVGNMPRHKRPEHVVPVEEMEFSLIIDPVK